MNTVGLAVFVLNLIFCVPCCLCQKPNGPTHGWNPGVGINNGLFYESPPQCLDLSTFTFISPFDVDQKFINGHRMLYYTGGSSWGYRTLARKFLGREVKNEDELNMMCPVVYPSFYSGYGVQFSFQCSYTNETCYVSSSPNDYDGNLGVDPYYGYATAKFYLIATDNRTYVVYYLCLGNYGDYMLLTTTKFASQTAINKFIQIKNNFGFHNSTPQFPVCLPPTVKNPYPFPFQNYLQFSGNENAGWSQGWTNGWGNSQSSNTTGWHSQ